MGAEDFLALWSPAGAGTGFLFFSLCTGLHISLRDERPENRDKINQSGRGADGGFGGWSCFYGTQQCDDYVDILVMAFGSEGTNYYCLREMGYIIQA